MKVKRRVNNIKLFEIRMLDDDGYPNVNVIVAKTKENAMENLEIKYDLDEYLHVSVNEVKIDGYTIDVSIDQNGAKELDTEGWYVKVGQVYSSPFQPAHFKLDKIILSESCDSDDAMLYGTWVSPQDYSKKIVNIESEESETGFRVWHLNQEYSLEADVEEEEN